MRGARLVTLAVSLVACMALAGCASGDGSSDSSAAPATTVSSASSTSQASTTIPTPSTTALTASTTSLGGATTTLDGSTSETPRLVLNSLAELSDKTYLPVLYSVPGEVTKIEFRWDPREGATLQWYSFQATSGGDVFVVTVAPSTFFEWSDDDAPDPAHYADIMTDKSTPNPSDNARVFIYGEHASTSAVRAFARELGIPGRQ